MVDASITSRSYTNLSLSFRGSERQAPSILSLALTFSKVMQDKASTGQHDGNLGTDARLKGIITEFNESPGVLSKWKIDSEKERAILNLLIGTSKGTRALIQSHLDYHKWAYCCCTSELLRSNRWLIGASRRGVKDYLKSVLTVSEVSQENFMTNMISNFAFQTRKTKQPNPHPAPSSVRASKSGIKWWTTPAWCARSWRRLRRCLRVTPKNKTRSWKAWVLLSWTGQGIYATFL